MRTFTCAATLLAPALPLVVCQHANASALVVDLGYARYQGAYNDSVINYFGIRYAAPPVGQLRWRPPVDIESHAGYDPTEVQDATKQGPICVQTAPYWRMEQPTGQEDCLLLDVLTPEQPANSYLPVFVQIHGGGYLQGDSQSSPGYAMVNQSQGNLIYVSLQYRLGAFGFLSSSEICENGAGNAGLLDQRTALNWVQRNIRSFGGDPARVTIIGGSAGGSSVMNQMILYGGSSSPPFRAAIAEYPWWQAYHNNTILEAQYRQLLATIDCRDLLCLREQCSDELIDAAQATLNQGYFDNVYGYGDFYYGPSVDGEVIRDLPSNEFKQGHFTKVPLLVNHDMYEGYNYSPKNDTDQIADLSTIFPYAKQSFFTRLYELYSLKDFNGSFWQRSKIYGDYIIDCPTYYMATAVADWGLPTWKLLFNAGTQLHGATDPFLFGPDASINNFTIANIMKDWYLGFTLNLHPNSVFNSGTAKPYWPQYSLPGSMNFTQMDVNYTVIGSTADRDANSRCDFMHSQSYVVRN